MLARTLVIAITALMGLYASPALALTTGECLPAAAARKVLASEEQSPIIVGNRTGYGYPTSLIFFSNGTGSRGYLIRGDKPLGQQAETVCVDSVYRDVRLNDITMPGIPIWARMPTANAKTAAAICGRGGLGYQDDCHLHNESLTTLERQGQRVMFVATGTAINPRDKSVRKEQMVVVTIDPTRGGGLIDAVTSEGAHYMLAAYTSVSYSQYGSAMLDRVSR